MEWILIVIIVAIIGITLIATGIYYHIHRDRSDYQDGGGTQLGGSEKIPLFAPANDRAGMWGEKFVNKHLRLLLREDEYLLANLLIPLSNGHKNEIDCVLISRKGIFCIEIKNWVGHISGTDEDEKWLQKYDDPYKKDTERNNPVKQNEGQCHTLKRVLNNKYDIDGAVIFADLEDGTGIDSDYTFTINEFKERYRSLDETIPQEELKMIYKKLSQYVATSEELEKRKEDNKRRFNN